MEQNAPPLEVLIAGSTYELVRDMVEAEPVDPVTPKGWQASLAAYRLIVGRGASRGRARRGRHGRRRACASVPPAARRTRTPSGICGMCGAALADGGAPGDSRKTVTIVFADPKPAALDGTTPSPEALRDVMTRYFEAMRVAARAPRRDRREVHRRRGDGRLRAAGPARGRRGAGHPRGGRDAGRPARAQRRVPGDLGHRAAEPHRGQHRRGDRRRREPRPAAGDRRRGQHGGPARAGRRRPARSSSAR